MQYIYHKKLSRKTKVFNSIKKLFIGRCKEQVLIYFSTKLSIIKKFFPQEYLYQKNSWRSCSRYDVKLKLDISNVVDHYTYFQFDDIAMDNFVNLVKSDSIVIDVGGNIGITAARFAKKAFNGKIIVVEPSKFSFQRLVYHMKLNKLTNVVPINKGLGTQEKIEKLYTVDENNSGMNRIVSFELNNVPNESISICKLDDLVQKIELKRIDFIKIDVEGYEMNVLKGAINTIINYKPIILIEVIDENLKENQSSALEVIQFLVEKNYKILIANTLEEIDLENLFSGFTSDLLCINKGLLWS